MIDLLALEELPGYPGDPKREKPMRVLVDTNHRCAGNNLWSARLAAWVRANGHELVWEVEQAEVLLLNACGVTHEAQDHELALVEAYRRRLPGGSKIVVFGCLPGIAPERLRGVEAIGFAETARLEALLGGTVPLESLPAASAGAPIETLKTAKDGHLRAEGLLVDGWRSRLPFLLPSLLAYALPRVRSRLDRLLVELALGGRAHLEIGSGCSARCSYCLIRKAKGKVRSRSIETILHDLDTLPPEEPVALVADDCGSYGQDLGLDLVHLLEAIGKHRPGIALDLTYLNPAALLTLEARLFVALRSVRLRSAVIPLQSGSATVLKGMRRDYDPNEVLASLHRLRALHPETVLVSHLIIGFPGEGWREFFRSVATLPSYDFTAVFAYAPPGRASTHHPWDRCRVFGRLAFLTLVQNLWYSLRLLRG
ncbi:MAG: hypothetical protein A2284_07285 [Deltaproteobacteria bacterium RIFOXYA12_FULL_61_11]|nr:MAG: hypothetical protein A2284_07285 [Deltaproteobacteria bacterium RIFOXYA12_FULL_61_11]